MFYNKFMSEKYLKWINYVWPLKKFKKKKMWKQCAVDMEKEINVKFTHVQVENHYKTVCKRKKVTIIIIILTVWVHLVSMIFMNLNKTC